MGDTKHDGLAVPGSVVLARELPFRIGTLVVRPAMRQVEREGVSETIEPRVMQVLVALAKADGEVVTRDDLIGCCWGGRIVGDDAINRVLGRLRHIAAQVGECSFKVETIPRVGYRLVETNGSAAAAGHLMQAGAAASRLSRRTILGGSLAATAAIATGGLLLRKRQYEPVPLAYQYYQRGLATRGQGSLELTEQGAALFRDATRIDPQYSDAWGALAWSYRALLQFGPRPDLDRLRALCRSAAARALKLNPDNADALAALLLIKPFYRNWAEIEQGCRELLRRHPSHSILEYNLADTLTEVGRWEESVPLFQRVMARERFWPLSHFRTQQALYASGRPEEAEDLIEEGLRRFPRRKDYWVGKIRHLTISGRLGEAMAFANDIANLPATGVEPAIEFEIMIARTLADGSTAARRSSTEKLAAIARGDASYLAHATVGACLLGRLDTCFAMLDGFYFGRGEWAGGRADPPETGFLFIASTEALRRDSRFPALVREIGLEDYWRATGTIPDFRRS